MEIAQQHAILSYVVYCVLYIIVALFFNTNFGPGAIEPPKLTWQRSQLDNEVSLSDLAIHSRRAYSLPFLLKAIPATKSGYLISGSAFIFVGLIPLWLLLFRIDQEWFCDWSRRTFVEPQDYAYLIGAMIYGGLYLLFNRILRCGWGVVNIPYACEKSGWKLHEWSRLTKQTSDVWPSFLKDLRRQRAPLQAISIIFLGLVSIVVYVCALLLVLLAFSGGGGALLVAIVLVFLATWIRRFAVQLNLGGMELPKTSSTDKLVLYLRAFTSDRALSRIEGYSGLTIEEVIVSGFKSGGRVVALGRPGELIPALGAERFYVDDSQWQNVVKDWINSSNRIVMFAAPTEATGWEISSVVQNEALSRFLILFSDQYEVLSLPKFRWIPLSAGNAGSFYQVTRRMKEPLLEELTLKRLSSMNIFTNLEWAHLPNRKLLGITFSQSGKITLLTSNWRNVAAYREAIKKHLRDEANAQ